MILFLDTEHTGFGMPANSRKLISLALVSEDGQHEWYAEVSGWELSDCIPWVQRHVLPLLTGPQLDLSEFRRSLTAWFKLLPRRVQVACDSPIDESLLAALLVDRPSNLMIERYDLAPLINTAIYNNTVAAYFAKGNPEHHALHDARAYRLGWLAWMDAKKGGRDN